ncbi:MAG: protein rep, partial [Halothiobacillaceae bacterium]
RARFYQALPAIMAANPKARFLLLTLTVRNCDIAELRATLSAMSQAWNRLIQRKRFQKVVKGWIRTTEVTRGQDGSAHPHFHCLLMVTPSYFKGGGYIKHADWVQEWKDALRLPYDPSVDIRTIKTPTTDAAEVLKYALKYTTKVSDLVDDDAWLIEYMRQTHHLRFVATGGVFKHVFRQEETDQDLVMLGGEDNGDDSGLPQRVFAWRQTEQRYKNLRRQEAYAAYVLALQAQGSSSQ